MWKRRPSFIKRLFSRLQPALPFIECVKMGIKALITITILVAIGHFSGHPLVIAPFAASCISVYTAPSEELAQPMNIIGGYFIACTIGILSLEFLPDTWWVLGLMLSVTITLMAYFRVTHPPASAIPFIMFIYHHNDDVVMKVMIPAILGSFCLIVIALVLHNLPFAKREYPKK
ncbi:MAG: hypothetical protein COV35_00620 [Alphaproteobacteria bacterium CG11_big_fil_rev_8_21_14_0_20_39_49]|nr:MAG: hypothetical protein COV35_00620 [Alphaproteobacteria bacterium CG11_big_fil_rev_8_21_14_0_20_39_49]